MVTSAAIVMVAVFAIFATLGALMLKEMGVGLAVAVLIDATIVRGRAAAGVDEAARRLELVPAEAAPVASADPARARGEGGSGARVGEPEFQAGRERARSGGPSRYCAVMPPSAETIAPVMNDASSEARKSATWAISSGRPGRPIGWNESIVS